MIRWITGLAAALMLLGCASSARPPDLPYPAYIDTNELFGSFLAELPGVEAKQFRIDMRSRASSNRVDFPPDWRGTTGGAPGRNLELYVLAGELRLSEFVLPAGGYAYVPAGSFGFSLSTDQGARVLYFLDDPHPSAHIRSPIIMDGRSLDWHNVSDGVDVATLRHDTGNESRTWLRRIRPGTSVRWESSSAMREGYLVSGEFTTSECFEGAPVTETYRAGGYFRRPAGTISGGPDSVATGDPVWFLRDGPGAAIEYPETCSATD